MIKYTFLKKNKDKIIIYFFILITLISFPVIFQYIDFSYCDEHGYVFTSAYTKTDASYGPIYTLWYQLIKLFIPDYVKAMIFGLSIIAVIFPLSILFLLLELKINKYICVIFCTLLLFSYINLDITPKSNFLAATIFSFTSGMFLRFKNWGNKLGIIGFGMLIGSYIRPEFHLLFWVVILYFFYRILFIERILFIHLVVLLILYFFSFQIFGNLFADKTNRKLVAFQQHYAHNYVKEKNLSVNPFTNFKEISKSELGQANSIKEVIITHPDKFIHHVIINLRNAGWVYSHLLFGILFPGFIFHLSGYQHFIATILLLTILYFTFRNKIVFRNIKNKHADNRLLFYFSLIGLIIHSATLLIVAPRYHYFAIQIPFILIILSVLINKFIEIQTNEFIDSSIFHFSFYLPLFFLMYFTLIVYLKNDHSSMRNNIDAIRLKVQEKVKDTLFSEDPYTTFILSNDSIHVLPLNWKNTKLSNRNGYLIEEKNENKLPIRNSDWEKTEILLQRRFILYTRK